MGICMCTSMTLILLSAFIYAAIGIAVTGGAVAAMVTAVKDLIPMWYSGIMLAFGLLVLLSAVVGFLTVCRKRQTRCWTGLFMLLTLLVLAICTGFTSFAWKTENALEDANRANFVNLSGFGKTAASSLKSAFQTTWDSCDAEVGIEQGDMYKVECEDDDLSFIEDTVNKACLDDPVTNSSAYYLCYTDNSWWAPPVNVPATPIAGSIDTQKGLFCQCADEVVDFIAKYYRVGKWIAMAICIFYLLVFLALCYLCCFVKLDDQERKLTELGLGGTWARP